MTNKIECAGGTVVKEGEKKWQVYAPDNRPVGSFPTKKQALAKAEHWDKWDAFASLQDMCLIMAPFSMPLVMKSVQSIIDGKPEDKPTEEEMKQAVVLDMIYQVFAMLIREGKTSPGDVERAMSGIKGAVAEMKKEKK